MGFKNIVKQFIPPVFFSGIRQTPQGARNGSIGWIGDYKNWDDAVAHASGYNDPSILEQVKDSMLKIKKGEAVYERDSVLFDEIQYSWPVVTFLLKRALENNGTLNVLDFGGSLGSSYFQNKSILGLGESLRWSVIEQKHFVDCGKQNFEDQSLRFYYDVEACLKENKPDVLLLSGVLQYLRDPYHWISVFNKHHFKYIIVDRTAFISDDERERIYVQQSSPTVSYPVWFLNKRKFTEAFDKYRRLCEFQDNTTMPVYIDSKYCYWSGLIFSGS